MKVICAWCKAPQGEKEPVEDGRISHVICKVCEEALGKKYKMTEVLTLDEVFKPRGKPHDKEGHRPGKKIY